MHDPRMWAAGAKRKESSGESRTVSPTCTGLKYCSEFCASTNVYSGKAGVCLDFLVLL